MAYTTATEVMELCPMLGTLTASTRVTPTGLERMIAGVEAEINVALQSQGYSAPYATESAFLTWLQKLATDGAAGRLYKAWFMDTAGAASQNQGRDLLAAFREGLAMIRSRAMIPASLPDSTAALPGGLTSTDAPAWVTMDTVF